MSTKFPDPHGALLDIMRLLQDAPRVTWTKPDGRQNTYICLHEDLCAEWVEWWTTPVTKVKPAACDKCDGTGKLGYSPCSRCGGSGEVAPC